MIPRKNLSALRVIAGGVAVSAALLAPWVLSSALLLVVTLSGVYAIAMLGLVAVAGWSGQLSLAQGALMGVGAITVGRIAGEPSGAGGVVVGGVTHLTAGAPVLVWGDGPLVLGLLVALAVGAVLSVIVGVPALRARGLHLAIATLGFGLVLEYLALRYPRMGGGYDGFRVRAPLGDTAGFYVVWAIAIGLALLFARLRTGKLGLGLRALSSSELAADGLGVTAARFRLLGFVFSGMLACLAGGLYAAVLGQFNYLSFNSFLSIQLLAVLGILGMGSVTSALAGGLLYSLTPELMQRADLNPYWVPVVFGVALVAVLMVRPMGILAAGERRVAPGRRSAALRRMFLGAEPPLPVPWSPNSLPAVADGQGSLTPSGTALPAGGFAGVVPR